MKSSIILVAICVACVNCFAASKEKLPIPAAHEIQDVEGWQVHVDTRLLSGDDANLGKHALQVLARRLSDIKEVVEPDKVARLQQVPIWLDRTHGSLEFMQYHPGAEWLKENGYSTDLTHCVHIPNARLFLDPAVQHNEPWVVLHELSHAYHDQVLSFDNPEIIAAWKRFVDSGKYKAVLHMSGRVVKHYGLTNHKEFFAEMTETYFGMNDYFPFNHVELKREEPELFALLEKIWGKLPQ